MTRSEAGKLGGNKTAKILKDRKEKRIKKEQEEYEENPKKCLNCGENIPFKKRFGKFCSMSCSASYTNKKFPKRKKKKRLNACLNCGKETYNEKYCSDICQGQYEYKQYILSWKNGEVDGLRGKYGISSRIRRYLFEKYNNSCQCCGWGKENIFTHKIPLEVHHIDGNPFNNSEENLQLLCPNCHSLTENYKSANKNGQRKERKKYYAK